jgi:hypothetical protein
LYELIADRIPNIDSSATRAKTINQLFTLKLNIMSNFTNGPSGGTSGSASKDSVPSNISTVHEIRISSGNVLDSVQFVVQLENGNYQALKKHGGDGGERVGGRKGRW